MALIEIEHLKKYYSVASGTNHAVDDVTMKIEKGRTMGVVGESGCGKSTLGRTIIRLHDATDGVVRLNGEDITNAQGRKLRQIRERMSIVFQDPYSSLNPRMSVEQTLREPLEEARMSVEQTLREPLEEARRFSRRQIRERTEELMDLVGIEERLALAYPHELDGGRRQRVGIARAIALNPQVVVCDEPVSALDVSIQAQVLNLLQDIQEQCGTTYFFITHDLSVVRYISDDISVMYLGQLVETSPSRELFKAPLHPYTKALLSAVPTINFENKKKRILLRGELTSPINPKPGCRFAPRCQYACEKCHEPQKLEEVLPGHFVACHRCRELNDLAAVKA